MGSQKLWDSNRHKKERDGYPNVQSQKQHVKTISEAQYNSIIEGGDLDIVYCDPFDKNIGKVRYYDTKGNKVSDSSAIADELNNKLVQGTVVKDKLDQRVKNKKLYLGKTHSEYFQDTSLANQVDQIKADLTQ